MPPSKSPLPPSPAELGIYPAVDPLDSTSRMLDARILGAEHYGVARGVQKVLQDYKNLQVRGRGGREGRELVGRELLTIWCQTAAVIFDHLHLQSVMLPRPCRMSSPLELDTLFTSLPSPHTRTRPRRISLHLELGKFFTLLPSPHTHTRPRRISLPSWAWMSCPRRTR